MSRGLLIIFISSKIIAQINTLPLSLELYLQSINPNGTTISYKLDIVNKCWDEYGLISAEQDLLNSIISIEGNSQNSSLGWDAAHSRNSAQKVFGYGVYKFSNSINDENFYINYSDCRVSSNFQDWYGIDMTIIFNTNEGKFYFQNSTPTSSNPIPISKGQLINIWELKQKGIPVTVCLQNFWQNCLVAIPSECSGSNLFYVPHLVWGQKPNYSA